VNLKKRKEGDPQTNLYTSSTNTNKQMKDMIIQDTQETGMVSLAMSIAASDRTTKPIKIL
jgi:hypothetical protein